MRAALEEPHDGDIVSEKDGVRIALHKGIGVKGADIEIDYSESGFAAVLRSI